VRDEDVSPLFTVGLKKLPPLSVTCHWLDRWESPAFGSEKALPLRVTVVPVTEDTEVTDGVFGEALGVDAVVKL
jgi:hypothetical protein